MERTELAKAGKFPVNSLLFPADSDFSFVHEGFA